LGWTIELPSHPPIKAAILDRFGDMDLEPFAVAIGTCSRLYGHRLWGRGAQARFVDCGLQQLLGSILR
jgi:hypothetical protein